MCRRLWKVCGSWLVSVHSCRRRTSLTLLLLWLRKRCWRECHYQGCFCLCPRIWTHNPCICKARHNMLLKVFVFHKLDIHCFCSFCCSRCPSCFAHFRQQYSPHKQLAILLHFMLDLFASNFLSSLLFLSFAHSLHNATLDCTFWNQFLRK